MVNIRIQGRIFHNVQALVFDKDGTLENSKVYLEKLTVERLAQLECHVPRLGDRLARALGFDRSGSTLQAGGLMAVGSRRENVVTAAAYLAETGLPWFQALQMANDCFDQADRQVIPNADTCPMFRGVGETLRFWQAQGVKIAIISAARQWSVERFIRDHGLQPWVNVAKGSDQGLSKPDPILYQLTCGQLGVKPRHTLMVGDALGDITMAKGAGAQGAIAIHWPGYDHPPLPGADLTISNLGEIELGQQSQG